MDIEMMQCLSSMNIFTSDVNFIDIYVTHNIHNSQPLKMMQFCIRLDDVCLVS